MNYLKRSLGNAWDFLKGTQAYFRDVLLMHGFILFICLPLLSSTTRFILHRGAIDYLSYDNIPSIFSQHPGVLLSLIVVLMTILLLVYFEFTFLLMSVFFIKKKEPISLKQLLHLTILQLKSDNPYCKDRRQYRKKLQKESNQCFSAQRNASWGLVG